MENQDEAFCIQIIYNVDLIQHLFWSLQWSWNTYRIFFYTQGKYDDTNQWLFLKKQQQ